VVFAIEVVSLFFARAIFVWFYNRTGSSVLLVCDLPRQLRCSNQPALLRCGTGVEQYKILDLQRRDYLFAATVIIATKGQLVRRPGALSVESDIAAEHTPDDAEGRGDPRRSDPRDA
jgi:hypothetical protein